MNTTVDRRLHVLLHAVAAGLLGWAGYGAGALPGIAVHWAHLRSPLLAAAAVMLVLGALPRHSILAGVGRRAALLTIVVVPAIACLEAGFRCVGFDFRQQAAALARVPPFYRKPAVPCGTVFFRREGPLQWTGPVIRRMVEIQGLDPSPYAAENEITVVYDEHGFRNETRPPVWDVAVAGDSFTELGHLPFDQLFTTLLGQKLSRRVLNLGVSNTGPLTQLEYLSRYGLSPATRDWIVVFFEGNDLADLLYERAAEHRFAATGRRDHRVIRKQTSFLRAVGERIRGAPGTPRPPESGLEAHLRLGDRRLPVTVGPGPDDSLGSGDVVREALGGFLDRFAALAATHGVRPWLAYMPCKRRVWHDRLDFMDTAPESVRDWTPGGLPEAVGAMCAERGIRFVNLTASLQTGVRSTGAPLYNPLFDSHLDAPGSRVVAEALAAAWETEQPQPACARSGPDGSASSRSSGSSNATPAAGRNRHPATSSVTR